MKYYQKNNHTLRRKEQGNATLIMSLVLLSVAIIIGTTSSRISLNEVRMTSNSIEKQKSLIAAESAIQAGWNEVNSFSKIDFLDPCNKSGVYDLRATAPATCSGVPFTNTLTAWASLKNPVNWDWVSTAKRLVMVDSISATAATMLTSDEQTNPMNLARAPQYTIALHEPVTRAGSTQVCFPVSIIGAAKGGVDETETLIEVRAIAGNSCFPNI